MTLISFEIDKTAAAIHLSFTVIFNLLSAAIWLNEIANLKCLIILLKHDTEIHQCAVLLCFPQPLKHVKC